MTDQTRRTRWGMSLAALAILVAGEATAEVSPHEFKVVGTWGNLSSWKDVEQPFWATTLPEMSGGALTGDVIPVTEAGLKGTEVMRLLKLGVFEIAHGVVGYVAQENPAIEGADLSSIAQDFDTMRAVTDAYRDELDRVFQETYGAKVLALHPFPASMIYCSAPVAGIEDLEGRKIRVHSATLGDFVEGAGGVAVTLPFAEVVPALEKGVADCAITDSMSAYNAKWHEVVDYVFALPVGYTITFTAINDDLWQSLDPEIQEMLTEAFGRMEDEGWASAREGDAMGVACLTGTGECTVGEPGTAELVEPTDADVAARQRILDEYVLARWADRCGSACVETWNATAGEAAGLAAPQS